jgi:hypothetical protein
MSQSQEHQRPLSAARLEVRREMAKTLLKGVDVPRPSQDEMSEEQLRICLDAIGELLQTVLPRGSRYVLALASPRGQVSYVITLPEKSAASLLRELSRQIDPVIAEGWEAAEEKDEG